MNKSPLLEEMKFLFLLDFIKWIDKKIAEEWSELEERKENGEFNEYEDYEAAMDYPLYRAKYAAEAVLHLLNALVDEQLRILVEVSKEYTFDPKKPALPAEKVSKLRFPEIKEHIEEKYKISLEDLDEWEHYTKIRNDVNNLKHSAGLKRLKEVLKKNGSLNELHYEPSLEDAKESVKICIRLVRSLHKIVNKYDKAT